jgi:hypothetical protein
VDGRKRFRSSSSFGFIIPAILSNRSPSSADRRYRISDTSFISHPSNGQHRKNEKNLAAGLVELCAQQATSKAGMMARLRLRNCCRIKVEGVTERGATARSIAV